MPAQDFKIRGTTLVGTLTFSVLLATVGIAQDEERNIESRSSALSANRDPDADTPTLPEDAPLEEQFLPEPEQRMGPPRGARRLAEEFDIWVDPQKNAVIMDGAICFREGPLEMFACNRGTKEHESIVSVNTRAFLAHAALLNVGADTGKPVQFTPEYVPPSGSEITIFVLWVDDKGQRHVEHAQQWVRDMRTGKALEHPWVFAGSKFFRDEQTGQSHYMAESGDFICVSNFSTAMLDLPVESSQANEGLAFEAFTERIPPLGTQVRLVLMPAKSAPKLPKTAADNEPRKEPSPSDVIDATPSSKTP